MLDDLGSDLNSGHICIMVRFFLQEGASNWLSTKIGSPAGSGAIVPRL